MHDPFTPYRNYLEATQALQYQGDHLAPGRVLLVDDDEAVRQTLAEGLRQAGFDVAEAASGAEGLQILRADTTIGVVLLDLLMPEMDGWKFRYEQRTDARLAAIPTVITTGAPLAEVIDQELMAADYLLKPIGLEHLVSVVAHYVRPKSTKEAAA
jgi:CheY-like chemotaxis protein